jgi:hypothetical protein
MIICKSERDVSQLLCESHFEIFNMTAGCVLTQILFLFPSSFSRRAA